MEPGVPTNQVLLAIEKLILQKKVDLIVGGPCLSEAGMAAMDLYARYDTLDIVSIVCYTLSWDKKVAGNPEKYINSLRAIVQDEQAAMMLGINSDRTAMISLAVGSVLAGLAAIRQSSVHVW